MARFRGQGAFEYLLILGGSVLIAAIVIMIVQGSAGQANNAITDQTHSFVDFLQNMSNVSH
ncbi:MAG: class III signal peptide-containing protein [Candidatus Micrarchaeia archaeon]